MPCEKMPKYKEGSLRPNLAEENVFTSQANTYTTRPLSHKPASDSLQEIPSLSISLLLLHFPPFTGKGPQQARALAPARVPPPPVSGAWAHFCTAATSALKALESRARDAA